MNSPSSRFPLRYHPTVGAGLAPRISHSTFSVCPSFNGPRTVPFFSIFLSLSNINIADGGTAGEEEEKSNVIGLAPWLRLSDWNIFLHLHPCIIRISFSGESHQWLMNKYLGQWSPKIEITANRMNKWMRERKKETYPTLWRQCCRRPNCCTYPVVRWRCSRTSTRHHRWPAGCSGEGASMVRSVNGPQIFWREMKI